MKNRIIRQSLLSVGLCTSLSVLALAAPMTVCAEEAVTEAEESSASLDALTDEEVDASWKVADASQYVSLGDLDLLEVIQYRYMISDSDIDTEMENVTYEYGEMANVETAEYGDLITMDFSYVVDGEEYTEEGYLIDVGYEEISAELDEKLTGCKVGDEISLTQSFDADAAPYSDWEGATVEMSAIITAIERTTYPELTDEWVSENLGFDDLEAYRASVAEDLQAYYDEESQSSLLQDTVTAAMAECEFSGYPEDLYEDAYASISEQYAQIAEMWGMELEELLEAYGMDENAMADSAVEYVNYQLFLSAYAEENNVSISVADVTAYLEGIYESYGYGSAQEMLDDYDVREIAMAVAEEQISTQLLENANVSVDEYNYSDEEILDEDETEDDWEDWEDMEEETDDSTLIEEE